MSKQSSDKSLSKTSSQNKTLTKDEEIYQQIYAAILDHQLAPDTKLPEDSLAETFNVSRTIIRKVLFGLSHEGLVTIAPKRGARVAHPSIQEGKEVFEARRVIEVASLPLVIEKINKQQLEELESLNRQQKEAQQTQNLKRAIRLSGDFHLALILTSDNNSIYEYLHKLISRSSLIVSIYGSTQQHLPSCQGHSELLKLIAEGKIEESKKWMNDHLIDVEASLDFSETDKEPPSFKDIFS